MNAVPPLSPPPTVTKSGLSPIINTVSFAAVHVLGVVGLFFFFSWPALALCGALYVLRMFAITAGYHRYFSHRTFKTSRVGQFVLAFLAQSSAQKGALWWASNHRHHHRHSDQPTDLHSPRQRGFWHSHMLWIWRTDDETDLTKIRDFAKYPELVWLNTWHIVPVVTLAVLSWLALGWSGLFLGFMFSTVLTWHGTFTINSLSHVWGTRRFDTTDDSRNNPVLALITLGEGWHNNHHRYCACARQGLYWWEVDITYLTLKALSVVGLVWDIREPPASLYEEAKAAA